MSDYLYGSARVRSLENAIVGRERLNLLLDCKNSDELVDRLREYGMEPISDPNSGKFLREDTLLQILRDTYSILQEMLPDDKALRLWLYPYDCNNLKAALKCFFRGIDPIPMMFDFGTVAVSDVIAMVENGTFESMPFAMKSAAETAVKEYAKTKNPQLIDLLLDRACYADMLSAAGESGVAFASNIVRKKIDLTNILITVRILRMNSGEVGRLLYEDALIDGGYLSRSQLKEWFLAGEEMLWDRLLYSEYSRLAESVLKTDSSLTAVERCIDDYLMERIKEVKLVPYGAEVMISYLFAREYEVRNLRIVFAGKEAGLPTETIRERIRESYV